MIWFIVILVLLIPLVSVVLDSQLGRAIAARLERPRIEGDPELGRRVGVLEAEVERLNREVQRLEEESDFLNRLLDGRTASGVLRPGEGAGEP